MNITHTKEHLDNMRVKAIERMGELKEERIKEYNKNPKLCKYCGTPIPYDKHKKQNFCNQSCSAKFNNKVRAVEKHGDDTELKPCLKCGKIIPKAPNMTWDAYKKRQFCCRTCQKEYTQEEYIRKWKSGEVSGNNGDDLSERIRQYMFEKVGYKCERCSWAEVNSHTGRIPLEVHHKDGNPYNNEESNLEVLCPNCHALTKNYKGSRGQGRHCRKVAYLKRQQELKLLEDSLKDN